VLDIGRKHEVFDLNSAFLTDFHRGRTDIEASLHGRFGKNHIVTGYAPVIKLEVLKSPLTMQLQQFFIPSVRLVQPKGDFIKTHGKTKLPLQKGKVYFFFVRK